MRPPLEHWHFSGFPVCSVRFFPYWILSRYSSNPFEDGGKLLIIYAKKGALNTIEIEPAVAEPEDGAPRDHYRIALLELWVSTGSTMEQYRKELHQNLAQTRAQLNNFLGRSVSLQGAQPNTDDSQASIQEDSRRFLQ